MRIWTLSLAAALAGVVFHVPATAYGQSGEAGFAQAGDGQRGPADPAYEAGEGSPFVEEPIVERRTIVQDIIVDDLGAGCDTSCGPGCGTSSGRGAAACGGCATRSGFRRNRACGASCGRCGGAGLCTAFCCPGEPLPLFRCDSMEAFGLRFGGWIDHGVSVVANSPADRYNGVVAFNDRDGEYQMNQLWSYLERETNPYQVFDVGGRIDFVYGTDARFTQAVDGLEANWGQDEPFYQAALPQFYLDASVYDWTFRIGHFLSLLGYEDVPAPTNFFYSHSYAFVYGEPKTQTGMLLLHDVGPFSLTGGLQRGLDQFDDTDGLNSLGYLGSVSWTNWDGDITTSFGVSATEQGPGIETLVYSLVGMFDLTDRLKWVVQHDYGRSTVGRMGTRAQWYGLNQYFLYEINCRCSFGIRYEWFHDEDGTRVTGLGSGNRATGPFIGDFYEVTLGLNWRPHSNMVFRPEVRWDWFDQDGPGAVQPFDAGQSNDQLLYGCDMIFTF